jgi:mercuric ion binding protein
MCKNKIETAAKSINGVSSALWEAASQNLTVVYNKSTTEIETIHKAIANVGYDTDKLKAEDEVYNKLHSCCKYDR